MTAAMGLYERFLECGSVVATDTRTLKGGEMFFALKGENFDGNDYALKALEAGASCAVVSESASLPDAPRLIKVPDTLAALQQLAAEHREKVGAERRVKVLGLTGTNGKTTTKELISAVLSTRFRVTATRGNLNNDIGVPLTVLSIRPDTEIAVVEMGASHPDDIEKLVRVCRPDYGLITNVGRAHLLGFGSFEGIKKAKGALYDWLASQEGSIIFLNADDPDLLEMARGRACHVWSYGIRYDGAQILPGDIDHPFLRLRVGEVQADTSLVGAYNAVNILAALAVGRYFGVPDEDAARAISSYVPSNNRSQLMKTGRNTLIVDAYNANPSSMKAALDNFAAMQSEKKLVLLGDMRELGDSSSAEHLAIVRKVLEYGIPAYWVGEEFGKALDASGSGRGRWFPDSQALASALQADPPSGALILVKGSRGIRMENAISSL